MIESGVLTVGGEVILQFVDGMNAGLVSEGDAFDIVRSDGIDATLAGEFDAIDASFAPLSGDLQWELQYGDDDGTWTPVVDQANQPYTRVRLFVPEPGTGMLMTAGVCVLAVLARRGRGV